MAAMETIENNDIATGAIVDGTQALSHDAYDVQEFDRAVKTYQRLAAAVNSAGEDLHTASALIRDLFWSFHKRAPRINENLALKPAFAVNRQILEEIMSTAEWRQLREAGSINDPMISAIATIGACERAIEALDPNSRNHINRLAAANDAAEKLFGQADVLDELASQATAQQVDDLRKRADKARAAARRQERAAAELEESLDADDDERDRAIRLAARQGMAEALDEAEAIQNAVAAFGGGYSSSDGGSGAQREMTAQEKIELATRVMRSPRLKLIAEMCGRFTRIAMSVQKTRVNHPPSEITSITIGNDLAHLLPGEVALLCAPDLEDLFYLKFAERRLLQYELEGREPEGRGPIILALDESGSMSEPLGGIVKEAWSKSVMLGLLAIARRQKRDLAVIHFSGPNQLRTSVFPKGESTPLELIDAVEFFFGGGTVFDRWMEEAVRLVDQDQFDRADVIVISDGIAFISERAETEWWKRRAERKTRCYGILIGTDHGTEALSRISDAVMTLDDLKQDLDVLESIYAIGGDDHAADERNL
ncbi:MAG: hypothetical protein MOB07_25695 [Acidobacteria bacterium]|nr:hypothetical protein [Acidobacteriota bacterium]